MSLTTVFTNPSSLYTKASENNVGTTLLGPGGGGGSAGINTLGASVISGGAGGGGGAYNFQCFPASILGSTETVTVPVGGNGGVGVTSNGPGNHGQDGGNGTSCTFGGWMAAQQGKGGGPGTILGTGATGGLAGVGVTESGSSAGSTSSATGTIGGSATGVTLFGCGGGGGGAGINSAGTTATTGGNGGGSGSNVFAGGIWRAVLRLVVVMVLPEV